MLAEAFILAAPCDAGVKTWMKQCACNVERQLREACAASAVCLSLATAGYCAQLSSLDLCLTHGTCSAANTSMKPQSGMGLTESCHVQWLWRRILDVQGPVLWGTSTCSQAASVV